MHFSHDDLFAPRRSHYRYDMSRSIWTTLAVQLPVKAARTNHADSRDRALEHPGMTNTLQVVMLRGKLSEMLQLHSSHREEAELTNTGNNPRAVAVDDLEAVQRPPSLRRIQH